MFFLATSYDPFNVYTYPNPKTTPYNNSKTVIIVVQCDKNYAIFWCAHAQ